MNATVIIPTIGRLTLLNAVQSAVREGFEVIVIADGDYFIPELPDGVDFIRLGKRFGQYGSMCYNVGALVAKTEFIVSLADDDELGQNFGQILSNTLNSHREIDIWIPQLLFNDGGITCIPEAGVQLGNVCAPIYRTSIFTDVPFVHDLTEDIHCIDFYHITACLQKGYKLSWQERLRYMVRPNLSKRRGLGNREIKMT